MVGKTNTTTQNTSTEPWKPSQPLLKTGLNDAEKLYKNGVGSDVYTGSTVIPYSKQTTAGMSGLDALSKANSGGKGLSGSTQDILNQDGFNDYQMSALKNMQKAANSKFAYSPEFEKVLGSSLQNAQAGVNANASAAGRYGSGIAQGVMTRELGDLSSKARLGEYKDWQDRSTAATNSLFNAGQAGLGNMQAAYGLAQQPAQTQMQLGGMYEDLAGRLKNDELRIFNEKQNKPWEAIQRLIGVGNLGGQYSTSNQTAQTPGQNPFLSAIGAGSTGLGLLGSLF